MILMEKDEKVDANANSVVYMDLVKLVIRKTLGIIFFVTIFLFLISQIFGKEIVTRRKYCKIFSNT